MSSSLADDLLWGALAVDGGYLTPTDIATGWERWLAERGRSLVELWSEGRGLSGEIAARLKALVADKACYLPEVVPADEELTEIQAGLPPLPPPAATAEPFDWSRFLEGQETQAPPAAQRYQRVRLHASGGIGQVWRAWDAFLQREVALKEFLPVKEIRETARRSFLQEARLTSQLGHPNIVPVHDLVPGQGDDGPYYLMRFLEGRTLKQAVEDYHEQRRQGTAGLVERNRLLSAFVQVCQAVAFAHARGVLHRDLKGRNIQLGDFGEVVVLDWGLALPITECGVGIEATFQPKYFAGTPAYMAPEQAMGRGDLHGPATDVFGLGAVLYEILTGQTPTHPSLGGKTPISLDDLGRARREEDVVPPRLRQSGVPPALDAICLKALARDPAQRYAGAAELAGEVQAFLADEPVQAYREPWTAQLGRWARRHKTLVTGLAVLVLAGLVGLGVTTLLVSQEQGKTEAAAERARRHFRQAREAVDLFFVKVSEDRLLQESGLQPLRRDLLQIAKGYYERFLDQDRGDDTLKAELGGTLYQLASVTRELGEPALARRQLQDALERFQTLARQQPEEPRHRLHVGMARNRLGAFHEATGDSADAETNFRQALPELQEAVKSLPDSDEAAKDQAAQYLAYCEGNLGMLLLRRGAMKEAEELLRHSLRHYRQLAAAKPDDPQRQDDQAAGHTNLAVLLIRQKQRDEALAEMRQALAIHQDLVKQQPRTLAYRRHLSKSWNNVGGLLGPTAQGEEAIKEALRLREQIAAGNPLVSDYQRDLAEMWQSLGIHHYKRRGTIKDEKARAQQSAQADAAFQHARTRFAELAKEAPGNLVLWAGEGIAQASLGDLRTEENSPDGLAAYRQGYSLLKKALDKGYQAPEARHYFRNCCWGLADAADGAKNWSEALGYWREALKIDDQDPGIKQGAVRTLSRAKDAGFFKPEENRVWVERLRAVRGLAEDKEFQEVLKSLKR